MYVIHKRSAAVIVVTTDTVYFILHKSDRYVYAVLQGMSLFPFPSATHGEISRE